MSANETSLNWIAYPVRPNICIHTSHLNTKRASVENIHCSLMWIPSVHTSPACRCVSCIRVSMLMFACVHSGIHSCMLAAAACRHGNFSQSLSIQVELRPEEINRLTLPVLVCHEAPTLSPAMHSNCVTLCCAPGKGFRLAKGSQPHLRSLNLKHGTCLDSHG